MLDTKTRTLNAHNEVFAIRDGEVVSITEERPTSGRWFAVMVRSVSMPDGEKQPVRQLDGAPVEMAAIIACQINVDGKWQWMQLSPETKENVGDMLFDCKVQRDKWYFAQVSPSRDSPPNEPVPEYEALAKKLNEQMRATEDGKPEGTRESLELSANMLEKWAADSLPANHLGQVHFARAMMEGAADEIRAFLKAHPLKEDQK